MRLRVRLRVRLHVCVLFQGCLTPVKVIIPPGSILQPSLNAAVVGGNVLTSQRVVDVIFKAFQVCAASQVCTAHLVLTLQSTEPFNRTMTAEIMLNGHCGKESEERLLSLPLRAA